MILRKLFFLLTLISSSFTVQSQDVVYCGFDDVLQKLAVTHEGFQDHCRQLHSETVRAASESQRSTTDYEIQVVFHVVYNAEEENLPEEVITNQIEILNADYRRLNADADQTREIFQPIAADSHIQFALATEDPDGNATNGINYVETDRTSFEFNLLSQDITLDEVKSSETGGADPWDTDRYLNIWVCNISATLGAQIFGFAYPPVEAPNWEGFFDVIPDNVEGVVVHYTTVGSNNPSADEDGFDGNEGGRTLTHEIGHYLGLRHTWGDAFFNGCGSDDGIADTPNISGNNNFACNFDLNTCTEAEGEDFPDMGENYMDYNRDDCVNMFTEGQVDAMRFVLENFRPELIEGQIVSVNQYDTEIAQVFPNPSSGVLNVVSPGGAEAVLLDAMGRSIFRFTNLPERAQINLSAYPAGCYLLQVETPLQREVHRIILN